MKIGIEKLLSFDWFWFLMLWNLTTKFFKINILLISRTTLIGGGLDASVKCDTTWPFPSEFLKHIQTTKLLPHSCAISPFRTFLCSALSNFPVFIAFADSYSVSSCNCAATQRCRNSLCTQNFSMHESNDWTFSSYHTQGWRKASIKAGYWRLMNRINFLGFAVITRKRAELWERRRGFRRKTEIFLWGSFLRFEKNIKSRQGGRDEDIRPPQNFSLAFIAVN